MAKRKPEPSNPATRKAPNRINGDVKGGAFVQGENHGAVVSIGGGDAGAGDMTERFE